MSNPLLDAGIACIIAAIVGGGLKAFGIEIPALSSVRRQILLATFGCILVLSQSVNWSRSDQAKNPQETARDDSASPSLSTASLKRIDIGTPREMVEALIGPPISEKKQKADKKWGPPIDVVYCRYIAARRDPDSNGDEYRIAQLRTFYDGNNSVAWFTVEADPRSVRYEFPDGTVGQTTFEELQKARGEMGPMERDVFFAAKSADYVEEWYLKRDRYYWLAGAPAFIGDSIGIALRPSEERVAMVDRSKTVIERVLVFGPMYTLEGLDDYFKNEVLDPFPDDQ